MQTTDIHTLLATDHEGRTYRSDAFHQVPWGQAIDAWYAADDARRAGKRGQVAHYEVRAASDPRVRAAKPKAALFADLVPGRGFKHPEEAARKALLARVPNPGNPSGVQGMGGWYYRTDGSTLAQGLPDLARIATQRGWIVQTADGRWHPVAVKTEGDTQDIARTVLYPTD